MLVLRDFLSSAPIAPWLFLLLVAGCAAATSPGGDSSGSLALDLTVSGEFEIDEVSWKISGGTQGMRDMDGTINIHWEALAGRYAPCVGIEVTNGVLADAQDGMVEFQGIAVSDPGCIGMDAYELAVSGDGSQLAGATTISNVEMFFTRSPDEPCFVGHWVLDGADYLGHIDAAPFGVVVSP